MASSSNNEEIFWKFFSNNNNNNNNNSSSQSSSSSSSYLPPWLKEQTLPFLNEEGLRAVAEVLRAGVDFRRTINEIADEKREQKKQAQEINDAKLNEFRTKCDEALSENRFSIHRFVVNAKKYQQQVEKFRDFVSTLETSLSSSNRIEVARENFNFLCNQLGEKWKMFLESSSSSSSSYRRPPWQLNYCAENDPFAPPASDESKVTFDGGKILDRFGRDVWEDRCYALGTTIQSGATIGVGVKRFRSVSRKNCSRSELWHGWIEKLVKKTDDDKSTKNRCNALIVNKSADESGNNNNNNDDEEKNLSSSLFSVQFNVCSSSLGDDDDDDDKKITDQNHHDDSSCCSCSIIDPFLNDYFVECNNQRVMAFLDICEKVDKQPDNNLQLQTAIVESFREYKNFPLLGRINVSSTSSNNNNNLDYFLTYQQVEHQCCVFLEFLSSSVKSSSSRSLRCIAAIIDDSPEWLVLDIACAVVGICFVGLHTCWPVEDLRRAINEIVEPDLIIFHKRDLQDKILPSISSSSSSSSPIVLLLFEEIEKAGVFCCNEESSQPKKSFTSSILQNEHQLSFFKDSLENNHFDIFSDDDDDDDKNEAKTKKNGKRPFTLMFSSGTSGQLKAVEVSCDAWLQTNFRQQRYQLDPYSVVSFNALAHGLDRGLCWTALFSAGRISFLPASSDVVEKMKKDIIEEILELFEENNSREEGSLRWKTIGNKKDKMTIIMELLRLLPDFVVGSHFCNPSVLVASPDLWTNLKNFIETIIQPESASSSSFSTATAKKQQQEQFKKMIQILFGRNINQAATGGAPVAPNVIEYFQELLSLVDVNSDVPPELKEKAKQKSKSNTNDDDCNTQEVEEECAKFYDVYGATEAPGISTNHQIRGGLEIGLILSSSQQTSSSSSLQNKNNNNNNNRKFSVEGELLVRGSGVARKYHNDETSSKNSFLKDGWYRTGDVVRLEFSSSSESTSSNNECCDGDQDELEKYFERVSIFENHQPLHKLRNFSSSHHHQPQLFVVDRVRDFIELYVDHQSAWVPASKVEEEIIKMKNELLAAINNDENTKNNTPGFHVDEIVQVAVFGDRMLPFLVAVVGLKFDTHQHWDETIKLLEAKIPEIFKSILFRRDEAHDDCVVPSFWIPQKVMIHQVVAATEDEKIDDLSTPRRMNLWKSGTQFRTHLGKLKRGALGQYLRNDLATYLC